MSKPSGKAKAGNADAPQTPTTARDSAQQIWLAGLGAFAKAHEEGGRMFEALVKEGLSRQRKTQADAEAKLAEATQRMSALASGLSAQAGRPWGGLENIFEDRVAKALNALGVPSSRELDALAARIDAIERSVKALTGTGPGPGAASSKKKTVDAGAAADVGAAAKPAAKRAPRKTAR